MRVRQKHTPTHSTAAAVVVSNAILQVARQPARPGLLVEPTGELSRTFPVLSCLGVTIRQLWIGVSNESDKEEDAGP